MLAALLWAALGWANPARSGEPAADDRLQPIRTALADIDAHALPAEERAAARKALETNVNRKIRQANLSSTAQWRAMLAGEGRRLSDDWQWHRDNCLHALRGSLGRWPDRPVPLDVHSSGTIAGDGFVIDKLVYQTRPGLWASANLYRPAPTAAPRADKSCPGILLSHSHHNPKTEGELQTMGMTWARMGALVLVPDHLGHGERRQHPFRTDADWPTPFKRSRQDYYFRYDVDAHLELVGESLMGWLAWDLSRGLDLLLTYPEVDPERTIVLGAVAGGGDVAAVAAALDPRFAAACVFNFGGPQPESRFPLPENPEDRFGYAGSGGWESTRNLRDSVRGGFLPWVIVGSIAPRRLIYAHEFSWDQEHDPVWRRLRIIYAMFGADDRLAFTHGSGSVKGQPPEATHCNNIGSVHRRMIYPALARWFGMPEKVEEYSQTRPAGELQCWTDELCAELKPKLVRELAAEMAKEQIVQADHRDDSDAPADLLYFGETGVLFDDQPPVEVEPAAKTRWAAAETAGPIRVERATVRRGEGVPVPLMLLLPSADKPLPLVIGVAQQGKERLLAERRELVARLLAGGVAVCLVDVRGTGETAADSGRDRTSQATSLSSSEQMLGRLFIAGQIEDLLAATGTVAQRKEIDPSRIALWGDSLAKVNPAGANLAVPHTVDDQPRQAEPLGQLLALFAAGLSQIPDIREDLDLGGPLRAIYVHRGLAAYAGAFELPRIYLPHDAIILDVMRSGDLPLLAAGLAPLPLRMEGAVDAGNRVITAPALEATWAAARAAYRAKDADAGLVLTADDDAADGEAAAADWLIERLALPQDREK